MVVILAAIALKMWQRQVSGGCRLSDRLTVWPVKAKGYAFNDVAKPSAAAARYVAVVRYRLGYRGSDWTSWALVPVPTPAL